MPSRWVTLPEPMPSLADRLASHRRTCHCAFGLRKVESSDEKDASGARFALIIGEDELAVSLRDLRETGEQQRLR